VNMKYIIYKTTNIINRKIYIGVHATKNPDVFDGYLGSGKILKQAIKKYGEENFHREILHVFNTPEEAFDEERRIVNKIFIERRDNYNIKIGGDGFAAGADHPMYGKHLSEEHKKKLSESLSGDNNPNYGKPHSEEYKKKISENHFDCSAENNPMYGKHHTEETKKKMRKSHLSNKGENHPNWGKLFSAEYRNKLSKSHELSTKIVSQRRKDIGEILKVRGWKTELTKKWSLSNSTVIGFIKKYALDLI